MLRAELLRDSHLIVESTEEATAAKSITPAVKPVAPSKLSKTALEPKRMNGKKVGHVKEPDFKVQRPWGGYHTAA